MYHSGNREHFDLTLKGQLYIGQSNWRLAQLIIAAVRALVFWNLIDIAFQTKKNLKNLLWIFLVYLTFWVSQ